LTGWPREKVIDSYELMEAMIDAEYRDLFFHREAATEVTFDVGLVTARWACGYDM
jgi:hypothetical protein